jgi:hypothetical protein
MASASHSLFTPFFEIDGRAHKKLLSLNFSSPRAHTSCKQRYSKRSDGAGYQHSWTIKKTQHSALYVEHQNWGRCDLRQHGPDPRQTNN